MLPSAAVPGAAAVWVADRLAGPPHHGAVVHAGDAAVYFRSAEDVIGVVSRHATAIPCSISTRADSVAEIFSGRLPAVGDEVRVGDGIADFSGHGVRVGRYVDFAMRPFDVAQVPAMREALEATDPASWPPDELDASVRDALRRDPAATLEQVLGRGSGLTPFGDDVVCGILATLLAADDPCAPRLRERVTELAPRRTTALSATLLRRAGAGDVLPDFAAVVTALLERPAEAPAAIAHLRTVGHTSGAGMLLGLCLALAHIHTRSCCP